VIVFTLCVSRRRREMYIGHARLSDCVSVRVYVSFFSSPNLSGRRLDVCHTSTHGVALVRI